MQIYKSRINDTIDKLPGLSDMTDEEAFFSSMANVRSA